MGVTAVDDHTLTYTLTYDFPGFLSLLCYLPYEPAYGPLLSEMGDQYATSAETLYSCGAFYLSDYESLETWIMKKNPENYDADNVFIDTISRIYNAEAAVNGPEMIKRGEIDEAPSALTFWTAGWPTIPPRTWSPWIVPTPTTPTSTCSTSCPLHTSSPTGALRRGCRIRAENWAKAINNTNFRKAFLYGINNAVTLAVSAPLGYDSYKLNTITPPNFCATTDGVDYTKCGGLADLTEFFDEAKAKEYRDAAIEELTAQGVTFPSRCSCPTTPPPPTGTSSARCSSSSWRVC